MSIKMVYRVPDIGVRDEITAVSIDDLCEKIEWNRATLETCLDIGGTYEITAETIEEKEKAEECMRQMIQAHDTVMAKKFKCAQNMAKAFASGCKVVLVQDEDDMRRASREIHDTEGSPYAECSPGQKGVTTPKGTIIVNLGAATDFDDLHNTFRRETARSAFIQAGLRALMHGRSVADLGMELQKIGVIPTGSDGIAAFTENVKTIKQTSAAKGVVLKDADAVEEVLAIMNQRVLSMVMSRKFGDGLIKLLAGNTEEKAKNFKDARRIVASILHGSKSPDIRLYGELNMLGSD